MGCGVSKNIVENTIVQSVHKTQRESTAPDETNVLVRQDFHLSLLDSIQISPLQSQIAEEKIAKESTIAEKEAITAPLGRAVIPSIPVSDGISLEPVKQKPVAFEIPLDDDLFRPTAASEANIISMPTTIAVAIQYTVPGDSIVAAPAESVSISSSAITTNNNSNSNNNAKLSLPKLALSEGDILAKLANAEERWKDLERAQQESHRRKRRSKPTLTSQPPLNSSNSYKSPTISQTEDPMLLKQRLLEKEAQATARRAKELLKLQNKLAKQEEHARQVQERKKKLGKLSNENLNLSWGGEDDQAKAKNVNFEKQLEEATTIGIDGLLKLKMTNRKLDEVDNDSGNGSSAVSVNNGSRSGSGRSLGLAEDGTEIIESK
ncbi:hypothetical protein HK100_012622 [Physocladia obscura]|uniref:Uncharacterized protein n=1 Tax=Physocladia obscura TaxID=109957 RepID=A0AAD5XLW5_9FUNG|nr:hypothetical protein HK100_012622 [Physocladia obscura]